MEAVKKPFKQLVTPDQAQRAIYIDFEGFEKEPPSLFGWVWAIGKKATDSNLACVQDIHDKSLQRLVGAAEIPEGSVNRYKQRPLSVGQAISELVRLADKQDRLIVSWSTHENDEIEKIGLSPDLLCIFNRNYRDGKVTAIEWFKRLGLDTAKGSNTLVRYLEQAGYPLPGNYGHRETTKRLTSVLGGINNRNRGSWDRLTDKQQNKWKDLLAHNFVDCHGLRHVIKTAAKALG